MKTTFKLSQFLIIACLSIFASSVFAEVTEADLSGMTLAKDEKNVKISFWHNRDFHIAILPDTETCK